MMIHTNTNNMHPQRRTNTQQKTQKNRYRGGIRKNMNSIDSFDSIDSDL
jgi:hypothetical protein